MTLVMEGVELRRVSVNAAKGRPEKDVVISLDELFRKGSDLGPRNVYSHLITPQQANAEIAFNEAWILIKNEKASGGDIKDLLYNLDFTPLPYRGSETWVKQVQEGHFLIYDGDEVYQIRYHEP